MTTTTKNGAVVPTGSDPYALTADLRKMMESAGLVMPVVSQAQRDAIPSPPKGMVVIRLDRWGAAEYWNGSGWAGAALPQPPVGHLGKTDGWTDAAQNPVKLTTAQVLKGGMQVSNNGLVVPRSGVYDIRVKAYYSRAATGLHYLWAVINGTQRAGVETRFNGIVSGFDTVGSAAGLRLLNAGDRVTLESAGGSRMYGTDGYDGVYLEVLWVGPAESY